MTVATVKQSLSANIKFGGTIDPSWTKSVSGLERGIGQLAKNSVKLTTAQKKLAEQIRAGVRAGSDVSKLRDQYQRLGDEIKRNTRDQDKFNRSLGRAKALDRFKRGGLAAGRAAAGFGKSAAQWGAIGLTGGLAATALSPILLADMAADKKAQSDKYQIPIKEYSAQEGFGNAIGLAADDFGEMFNTYKKKAGQKKVKGKEKNIDTYFPALGFKPMAMTGQAADKQFEKILNAAYASKDKLKADKAVAALLGSNGTKLLNALRANGMNYSDSMSPYRALSTLDDAGAAGAAELNDAMFRVKSAFLSGGMEIAGLLGHELAPEINNAAQALANWFKDGKNIDKVKHVFTDSIIPGLKAFGSGLVLVSQIIYSLAKKLSWIMPDEKGNKKDVLTMVARGDMEGAKAKAKESELTAWLNAILADKGKVQALKDARSVAQRDVFNKERLLHPSDYWSKVDDQALTIAGDEEGGSGGGFGGLLSDLGDVIKQDRESYAPNVPLSPPASAPTSVSNVFHVIQQSGENGTDFAHRVAEMAKQNAQETNRNNMADVPGV